MINSSSDIVDRMVNNHYDNGVRTAASSGSGFSEHKQGETFILGGGGIDAHAVTTTGFFTGNLGTTTTTTTVNDSVSENRTRTLEARQRTDLRYDLGKSNGSWEIKWVKPLCLGSR